MFVYLRTFFLALEFTQSENINVRLTGDSLGVSVNGFLYKALRWAVTCQDCNLLETNTNSGSSEFRTWMNGLTQMERMD